MRGNVFSGLQLVWIIKGSDKQGLDNRGCTVAQLVEYSITPEMRECGFDSHSLKSGDYFQGKKLRTCIQVLQQDTYFVSLSTFS